MFEVYVEGEAIPKGKVVFNGHLVPVDVFNQLKLGQRAGPSTDEVSERSFKSEESWFPRKWFWISSPATLVRVWSPGLMMLKSCLICLKLQEISGLRKQ